jgi:hypothetical protein
MGFYIRKGFNFGPLRLNLSRSGLGASVGVKGARIGIGPRGSYLHLGRDGFYYRQSLSPSAAPPAHQLPVSPPPATSSDIQEISSADASTIVDASATDLLEGLNRIKRRFDIFPIVVTVGAVLLVAILLSGFQWWFALAGSAAIAMLAIAGRHHDVTSGTAVLNYALASEGEAEFSKLQTAFESVVSCQRFWHVDAAGFISDWKRNAGASSLVSRSEAQALFALPSKVICNLKVPSIKAKHKSFYFFPDRLLIYDPSGVGAVSYPELQSATAHTKYIENEIVPSDSPQLGTTWRYVAKNGGPDRRFKNNRQLPIMQYGILALKSNSGVSEMFQCSAPDAPAQFVAEVAAFGRKISSTGGGVLFDVPRRGGVLTSATLGVAIVLMAIMAAVLFWNMLPPAESSQEAQARAEAARRQFETTLSQSITAAVRHKNVAVSSADDGLLFTFTSEGPKAARRDGLTPFNKKTFFSEFLSPHTEAELCGLGFKRLEFSANGNPLTQQLLDCAASPNPQDSK